MVHSIKGEISPEPEWRDILDDGDVWTILPALAVYRDEMNKLHESLMGDSQGWSPFSDSARKADELLRRINRGI